MTSFAASDGADLGPLQSGQCVAIIGGGPAGTSCALALKRQSEALGRHVRVLLFEPKDFRLESNVCVGVLSPPFNHLLSDLGLHLPPQMIQRRIGAYELHTDSADLILPERGQAEEQTVVVDRGNLDLFMLYSARGAGAEVIKEAVVDFRVDRDGVTVFGNQGTEVRCDVVVGAFGLTRIGLSTFEARTLYQRPGMMRSLLTDIPLADELIEQHVGNNIHALLLGSQPSVEFAALTPKRGHVTVNVAGPNISPVELDVSIAHFQRLGLLPKALSPAPRYGNAFPASPAHNIYRDRAVTIGNTSGLLRPLKGKGINAGLLTGMRAAKTMLEVGISRRAFDSFYKSCYDITSDYYYGIFLRWLYRFSRSLGVLDPVIDLAHDEKTLNRCFYNMVSGEGSYRDVVWSLGRPLLWLRIAAAVVRHGRGRLLAKA
ncbi:MAG: NAD(P)/FAD-dependent oxidoreductase [Chloroflexi bacterium]|nr:NAD(P)/FAD-dependent oxidoreductase [Chloroflexota bacterium]MCL5108500.1 NAD(P)/FAD-dependent oxidoreductase [Chloroflexota bacterium]